jgi:hypothetical protein
MKRSRNIVGTRWPHSNRNRKTLNAQTNPSRHQWQRAEITMARARDSEMGETLMEAHAVNESTITKFSRVLRPTHLTGGVMDIQDGRVRGLPPAAGSPSSETDRYRHGGLCRVRTRHSPEHCLLVRSDSCYGAWRVRRWSETGRYPKEQHEFGVMRRSAIAESGPIKCPKSLNGKNQAKTLTNGIVLEELESVLRDTDFRRPWGNAPPHSLSRTECGSARSSDLNPIEHI